MILMRSGPKCKGVRMADEKASNKIPQRSNRAGGRAAKKALRAAPLESALRPIKPGMVGGNYNPLEDSGVKRIHQAALDALESIGLADAPKTGIDILVGAGAVLGSDGRLRFPRSLVEDMLAVAKKQLTLHARKEEFDLELSGNRVHFGTAGAAVHLVDVENREYRDSTVKDLYNAAHLVDQLDNIHFLQRPMVCRDINDNFSMDLNTVYACCSGTRKHVGVSFTQESFVEPIMEMIHLIAGGKKKWLERPFISNSNCFVVPPMKFATESCSVMEACIKHGMPVLLLSAGQAGATAPASIAGAIVQAVAECLAGVIYVNAIKPGFPAIFGTWPFVSDLRTGAMSGGSGEQALLTAGCAQMHRFYGLPGGAAAGIADSKLPDMQAGWEQATSNVLAGLSGLNMVYESAGMHASLLGFCLESLVLGDDMLGQVQRCVRGIEVTEDSVNLEAMIAVCIDGPGHYLGHSQTLSLMQTEYVYPELGDRSSPKEWLENDRPDLLQRAIERKNFLLSQPSRARFPKDLDEVLRAKYPIYLK